MMTGICGQLCTKLVAGNVSMAAAVVLYLTATCVGVIMDASVLHTILRCRRGIPCVAATIEAENEVTVRFADRAVPGKSG